MIEFIKSPLDSLHKNWAREQKNLHKAKTADLSDTKCTSGHRLPPCGQFCWPSHYSYCLPVPACMHNQEYWCSQRERTGPQLDYFQFPRVKFIQACRKIYLKQQPQQCVSHAWGWSHKLNAATNITSHNPILVVTPYHWPDSLIMCLPQQSTVMNNPYI